MQKLISIIIPAHNNARTIKKCLASIFTQTYNTVEIIAVNDGSSDNTLEVLQKYADKIKIITQENSGAPRARNRGAREAQGEYLLFCDADVIMKEDMIAKMAEALAKRPDKSYAYCSFKLGWKKFSSFGFNPDLLKQMNYISTMSLLRKEHFPGFDESLKKFQDWDLWLTMLENGHTGVWIDEVLFKAIPTKKGMSMWFPKIFYKMPFWKRKWVEKYEEGRKIIIDKHRGRTFGT